jgi:hypothetical protein
MSHKIYFQRAANCVADWLGKQKDNKQFMLTIRNFYDRVLVMQSRARLQIQLYKAL